MVKATHISPLVPRTSVLEPNSRDFSSFEGIDMFGPTVHDLGISTVYVTSLNLTPFVPPFSA